MKICVACGHEEDWHTTGLSGDTCHCGCFENIFRYEHDDYDADEEVDDY